MNPLALTLATAAAPVAEAGSQADVQGPWMLLLVGMTVVMSTLATLVLVCKLNSALVRAGQALAARLRGRQEVPAAAPAGVEVAADAVPGVLIAVLTAAATEALGAPVRILEVAGAEAAEARTWARMGRHELFESHRLSR